MKYRRLSSTGDYTFGFGNNCFVSDTEAVAQAIKTKLSLLQGDYWEDLTDGLPFFQSIAGSNDKAAIDALYQARVLETPNVSSISSFESALSNRVYTATIGVVTAYNTTVEVTV